MPFFVTYTRRALMINCLVLKKLTPLVPRFNYGDMASLGNNSFVQLLPTTDQAAAWAEFAVVRGQSLASMPPAPHPTVVSQLLTDTYGPVDSGTDDDSGSLATGALGSPSGAVGSSDNSTDKLDSWVEKYGPVIIGLLAGNVVVGILLCIIALAACMRGVVRGGAKTRNIGSSYVPVKFREVEADSMPVPEYHD